MPAESFLEWVCMGFQNWKRCNNALLWMFTQKELTQSSMGHTSSKSVLQSHPKHAYLRMSSTEYNKSYLWVSRPRVVLWLCDPMHEHLGECLLQLSGKVLRWPTWKWVVRTPAKQSGSLSPDKTIHHLSKTVSSTTILYSPKSSKSGKTW